MTHEDRLRGICRERCADFGDPPCFELDIWKTEPGYCVDCRRDAGEEIEEPLDPNAVVKPLL